MTSDEQKISVSNPYFLTVRQFKDGEYSEGGRWQYVKHGLYSTRPSNYVRSFLLLQKDLLELFNYVEPSDVNMRTYSFRIQELLIRTCIEIEANFKAILSMNQYSKKSNLSIKDYFLIEQSHYLSQYEAKLPYWTGNLMNASRSPFSAWSAPVNPEAPWSLSWYDAYNKTKHDRANSLHIATFENLIDAFSALVILLSSQYIFEDFGPAPDLLQINSGWNDGYDAAIGDYFRILFPRHTPEEGRYDFNWETLSSSTNTPFAKYDYDTAKTSFKL